MTPGVTYVGPYGEHATIFLAKFVLSYQRRRTVLIVTKTNSTDPVGTGWSEGTVAGGAVLRTLVNACAFDREAARAA